MFNQCNSGYSLADIAAATGGRNNGDGWGEGFGGAWIIIIFILFAFMGWGNNDNGGWFGNRGGTGSSGAATNYVLASDFSMLSRQLSDGFNSQERKLDSISNGLCDGFYTNAQLINGVNMNIAQNGYESRLATQTLGSQMATCCCDVKQQIGEVNYNNAMNTNTLQQAIDNGFCQTNYNNSNNTRDIIDNQNAGIRSIYDKLCQIENSNKDAKIAEQNQQIFTLQLAASQAAQNNYLISQLKEPCAIPAYVVPNPNCCYGQNLSTCGGF